MKRPAGTVSRYTPGARANHWLNAIILILLALSGMALFHPALFFLTGLFGGGVWARILHPWLGVALIFTFVGLFIRFWRYNIWEQRRYPVDEPNSRRAGRARREPAGGRPLQRRPEARLLAHDDRPFWHCLSAAS